MSAVAAAAASLPSWKIGSAAADVPAAIRQTLVALVGALALVRGNVIDVANADLTVTSPAVVRNGNSDRVLAAVTRLRQNAQLRSAVADGPAATLELLRTSLFPNPGPPLTMADMQVQVQAVRTAIAASPHPDVLSSLPKDPNAAAGAFFAAQHQPETGSDASIRDGLTPAAANLGGSAVVVDAMTIVTIIAPPQLPRGEYTITDAG